MNFLYESKQHTILKIKNACEYRITIVNTSVYVLRTDWFVACNDMQNLKTQHRYLNYQIYQVLSMQ